MGEFTSQMSPDFPPQDQMNIYMYGDAMDYDTHNVTLFRGPISLVVPFWFRMAFYTMRGQILIFLNSGSMNALMCIEDILLSYIVPYMPFVVLTHGHL